MSPHICSCALIASVALTSIAFAGAPATFTVLPNFASNSDPGYCAGVSADGATVYGFTGVYGSGWVWTSSMGTFEIGGGRLCGASADGGKICGLMGESGMDMAGIWRLGPDWMPLGGLPDSSGCGQSLSTPFGMSRDGSVVAGLAWGGDSGCTALPMKWTQATGMTALPRLDEGHSAARVNAVSGNGQVFGGWEQQYDGTWRPVMWINGLPQAVAAMECECGDGEVLAINNGGDIAVGYEQDLPFIWTPSGGMQTLPNSAGAFGKTFPTAISDDGRIIVGHYGTGPVAFTAQVWIDHQPQTLQQYLEAHGADLTGYHVWSASGVSADGRVIVGTAMKLSNGRLEPYRATIDAFAAACPANIIDTGVSAGNVNIDDLLAVISAWGACPASCPANIVTTGASAGNVNIDDLLAVISAWGACP